MTNKRKHIKYKLQLCIKKLVFFDNDIKKCKQILKVLILFLLLLGMQKFYLPDMEWVILNNLVKP